ncbi:MAG TPA: wax ester/triacylglycerol synthase family O-acyltransferase [Acidimicrobiia bacterium]|nr:wax ester/triacylglycerol synthase family O-acyltransferase [Acidimicrobiia bacterium]
MTGPGIQRLSRTDAGFVAAETPEWHMHNGVLAVFEGPGAAERLDADVVRRLVTGRLGHLGLFRRRLVEMPGRLGFPAWEDAGAPDVDAHVHHATVRAPGGARELGRRVGEAFGTPLDRGRPLWELWRLDGLADGGVALLLKIHHACIDGLRGAEYATLIFDVDPAAPVERPRPAAPNGSHHLGAVARVGAATAGVVGTPWRAARLGYDAVRALPSLARFAWSDARAATVLPFQAPPGPFNAKLTARRGFAPASLALDDVRAVRRAFGVTVNDVVLATCTGALRRYLLEHGGLPNRALVAQVPMALRRPSERVDPAVIPGNLLTAMGAVMPVHLDDPADRVRAVHASTVATRAFQHAAGDDLLADLFGLAPPVALTAMVRTYLRLGLDRRLPPIFNAIVSNVPGPPVPLYCAGARLTHAYLLGPLLVGSGLNVTVVSYDGNVDVGIVVCPDVVDDPWNIADAMQPAMAELLEAAAGAESGRAAPLSG